MPANVSPQQTAAFAAAINAYKGGQFSEARASLEEFTAVSPHHAEARHLLAVLLARERRFLEAEVHFLAAITFAPQRHDFRCNYALALHDDGDLEKAVALFRTVLALRPEFAPALNGLGSALHKLDELSEAEQMFRLALRLQPRNAQYHNNLGNVLKERGLPEQAIALYRQALLLQPDYAEANFNLGVSLKELDRHGQARACFARALQLKPDYPQAAEQLEQVEPFWREPMEGTRIILRPYCVGDAQFLAQCFRNADFMAHYNQFLPTRVPLPQLTAALQKSEQSLPWRSRAVDWVIYRKGGVERPIGLANLADLDLRHRRAELQVGVIADEERQAGSGVEATLLVMDFAFNRARLNKLTSLVYEGNAEAQRITLRGGFTQEGFRPQHLRVAGHGYLGMFENGLHIADFRTNKRLARLSQRWLGRNMTKKND